MRVVTLGAPLAVLVWLWGCGDADQSMIDADYRRWLAESSQGSEPDTQTFSEQPATEDGSPGAMSADDAKESADAEPACEAPNAATERACSPDNAAASNTEGPPPAGEPSAAGTAANSSRPRGDAADGSAAGGSAAGEDANDDAAGAAEDGNAGGGDATGAEGGGDATGGAAGGGGAGGDPGQDAVDDGSQPPGGGSADPALLPDLIVDGAYLTATIQQDVVDASADMCLFNEGCVTGDGLRRVVRFGTRSANVGTADVVVGEPVAGNPLWEFDACHEHYHFEGYARYDLIDAATGTVLPIGNKNGFCLQDLDVWTGSEQCGRYDCAYQGISVGCADVYTPDLDCQWIDITDVAPGNYELVVTVNTDGVIQELRSDNNSASVSLQILPETVLIQP